MKKLFLITYFAVLSSVPYAQKQTELDEYLQKEHQIEKRSMIALTSWGGLNLATGIPGMLTTIGESKYFHQMNGAWGAINAGIGLTALLIKKKTSRNSLEALNISHRTEKILYINTGLDVAYVTAGFLFRSQAKNNPENVDRFRGFGNSLLLQGGFLLLFDITQLAVHTLHRKNNDKVFSNSLSLSDTGIGLKYTFN